MKDENNCLKGEQANPQFKPKKNYSSNGKDKDSDKPKVNRRDKIVIDKKVKIDVAAEDLPEDAYFTNYDKVLVICQTQFR